MPKTIKASQEETSIYDVSIPENCFYFYICVFTVRQSILNEKSFKLLA